MVRGCWYDENGMIMTARQRLCVDGGTIDDGVLALEQTSVLTSPAASGRLGLHMSVAILQCMSGTDESKSCFPLKAGGRGKTKLRLKTNAHPSSELMPRLSAAKTVRILSRYKRSYA